MNQRNIGIVGLAVMGANLALNIESRGFPVAVYNRTKSVTEKFMAEQGQDKDIKAVYSLESMVLALERPRQIILMVKAGKPVDAVIDSLAPLLDPEDIIVDGGNSLYEDTVRRSKKLEDLGFGFIGMGVSGGEEGALHGPSLMPGGTANSYRQLEPVLTKIAAQTNDGACVTYLGKQGAGHYVKMVHNGIEYGDMQLIAEAYDLMKNALDLDSQEIQAIFNNWNDTELNSFLIEITANIFGYTDPITKKPIINSILDAAGQKGTGRWTVLSSLDLGVPIPTIYAAVNARVMSAYKQERVAAAQEFSVDTFEYQQDKQRFIDRLKDALYCSKICSYAQGMALLSKASQEFGFHLNLSEIARIWEGGCIIRASLLDDIKRAYRQNPDLANLLLAPQFKQAIAQRQSAWREVIATANQLGIAIPAFSSSLNYFDTYRREILPQNLTQAQRDYFGAHTYERVDKTRGEFFHTEWRSRPRQSLYAERYPLRRADSQPDSSYSLTSSS